MFNSHDINRNEFLGCFTLVDEIKATHIGCEYGEYGS